MASHRRFLRSSLVVLLLALGGCRQQPTEANAPSETPAPAQAPALSADALAQVGSAQIHDFELERELETTAKHAKGAERRKVLEALVQKEVLAQRALALGLDRDPGYQAELRAHEADLTNWKRKRLADLYYRAEVDAKATPSDAEAKQYFDENAARIRSELHVAQLLFRDEPSARAAHAELRGGKPFEQVAKELYPEAAHAQRPWDLGYLNWTQLPEPWQPSIHTLAVGQTSDVIAGPGGRHWIVQLLGKREVDKAFETEKGPIVERLRAARSAERRSALEAELPRDSSVRYAKRALELPAH